LKSLSSQPKFFIKTVQVITQKNSDCEYFSKKMLKAGNFNDFAHGMCSKNRASQGKALGFRQ
jgi:hypothetical protein